MMPDREGTRRWLDFVRRLPRLHLIDLVNALGVDRYEPQSPREPGLPHVETPSEFRELPIEAVHAMARRLWPKLMRGLRWPERGSLMPTVTEEIRTLGMRAAATIRTQHPEDVKLRQDVVKPRRPEHESERSESGDAVRGPRLATLTELVLGGPKEQSDQQLVSDFIQSYVPSVEGFASRSDARFERYLDKPACGGCDERHLPATMFPCVSCEALFCAACATLELARTAKCERCR